MHVYSGDKVLRQRQQCILLSIIISAATLGPALTIVFFADSVTLHASVFYSISQLFVLVLAWGAIRAADTGKSHWYNFGYGKLESLASLAFAGLLAASLIIIIYTAVRRITSPVHIRGSSATGALAVLIATTILVAWEWRHARRLAGRQFSPLLEAAWRLFRAESIAYACAAASLAVSLLAPSSAWWSEYIDPAGAILQAAFLCTSAYAVIALSVNDLLDGAVDESLQLVILRVLAEHFQAYTALHGMRSRHSGKTVFVELFLEFPGQQPLAEALQVMKAMQQRIERQIPEGQVIVVPARQPPG